MDPHNNEHTRDIEIAAKAIAALLTREDLWVKLRGANPVSMCGRDTLGQSRCGDRCVADSRQLIAALVALAGRGHLCKVIDAFAGVGFADESAEADDARAKAERRVACLLPHLAGEIQAAWILANGSHFDQVWLADHVTYVVRTAVVQWMTLNNITTYTDDTLGAARVISAAIATVPAVIPDTIGVVFIGRDQVVPANIVARIYFDYTDIGTSGGIINQFGTPNSPIPITIIDG